MMQCQYVLWVVVCEDSAATHRPLYHCPNIITELLAAYKGKEMKLSVLTRCPLSGSCDYCRVTRQWAVFALLLHLCNVW